MVNQQLVMWVGRELWKLPEWYTRREIAELIGASKSPTLIKVLGEAVEEGVLEAQRFVDGHNRPVIKYRIASHYRSEQLYEAKNYGKE